MQFTSIWQDWFEVGGIHFPSKIHLLPTMWLQFKSGCQCLPEYVYFLHQYFLRFSPWGFSFCCWSLITQWFVLVSSKHNKVVSYFLQKLDISEPSPRILWYFEVFSVFEKVFLFRFVHISPSMWALCKLGRAVSIWGDLCENASAGTQCRIYWRMREVIYWKERNWIGKKVGFPVWDLLHWLGLTLYQIELEVIQCLGAQK